MLRQLAADFLHGRTWLNARRVHMGYIVDRIALGQDVFEYVSFPCQYHPKNVPYSFIHL